MVSTSFASVIGQLQAIELLTQAVQQNRVAPAYLFAGPIGVGRSLTARCFLELLLVRRGEPTPVSSVLRQRLAEGNHPDLLWVEPTYIHQGKRLTLTEAAAAGLEIKSRPQVRIEQVRQIAQFLSRSPLEAARSVVVIEAAETMAEPAANCLLKTLEEPGTATLILIAPGVESLLPTLVSRCQRIPFYRLTTEAMMQVLTQTGHEAVLAQPQVLEIAQGSPGAAIASWETLQSIPPELLQTLTMLPQSARAALELARQIDRAIAPDVQLWLIDYLQQCYWRQQTMAPGRGVLVLQQLEKARQALLHYANPRLVWEVTLLALSG